MPAGPWSDEENDAIVADYFAMLSQDLAGRAYSKAAHNRRLQARIGRGKGSIEFKHQNISAVLKGANEAWLAGYLPAFNYQRSLEDAVERWFEANPDWFQRPVGAGASAVHETAPLWIGPAPTLTNQPPPAELEHMRSVARRFDAAARDERNRALGRAGEIRVLAHERAALTGAGRPDLAERVRWVAELDGDGAGYDIASFEPDGRPRLLEVKTTNGWDRSPFHITRNELDVAERERDAWVLFRLWNFAREPRAFELRPPLDRHVALTATVFEGRFG